MRVALPFVLIRLLLVLALAVTSVTSAQARAERSSPVERLVICAGGAEGTVWLDAQGNPTGPRHLCPDCTLAAISLPAAVSMPARPMRLAASVLPSAMTAAALAQRRPLPPARAPPAPV